ncbi:hypothetical protein SCP_0506880 [Sparassis crispa]|uniref:Uncharacterized protein n=1 Tax=Sparassis crispa TaxID=139825 RepID=A0A401GN45_9APHY|nr:hypothetical protein SCP_0506880 [Sparassis crispa]GBE83633.1 hypothetical protein SCP_0506880 [Sparassis crispa]
MTNRAVVFRKFAETGVWSRKCGGGLGDTQGARSLLAAGGGGGHAESLVPRGAAVIAIVDPVAALPGFLVGAVTVGHAGRRIQRPSLTLRGAAARRRGLPCSYHFVSHARECRSCYCLRSHALGVGHACHGVCSDIILPTRDPRPPSSFVLTHEALTRLRRSS